MNNRKMKEFEKQMNRDTEDEQMAKDKNEAEKLKKFIAIDEFTSLGKRPAVGSDSLDSKRSKNEVSNMSGEKRKTLPSFWIPELNPTASASKMEKPVLKILCPMSGRPLRVKDLMPVKFTPVANDDGRKSISVKEIRYMCPITHDVLTNSTRCAYLKTSQNVVTMEAVEKLIKKDMIDPTVGKPITDDDIIELQRGGTGFSATNEVKAKLIRPQLELQ